MKQAQDHITGGSREQFERDVNEAQQAAPQVPPPDDLSSMSGQDRMTSALAEASQVLGHEVFVNSDDRISGDRDFAHQARLTREARDGESQNLVATRWSPHFHPGYAYDIKVEGFTKGSDENWGDEGYYARMAPIMAKWGFRQWSPQGGSANYALGQNLGDTDYLHYTDELNRPTEAEAQAMAAEYLAWKQEHAPDLLEGAQQVAENMAEGAAEEPPPKEAPASFEETLRTAQDSFTRATGQQASWRRQNPHISPERSPFYADAEAARTELLRTVSAPKVGTSELLRGAGVEGIVSAPGGGGGPLYEPPSQKSLLRPDANMHRKQGIQFPGQGPRLTAKGEDPLVRLRRPIDAYSTDPVQEMKAKGFVQEGVSIPVLDAYIGALHEDLKSKSLLPTSFMGPAEKVVPQIEGADHGSTSGIVRELRKAQELKQKLMLQANLLEEQQRRQGNPGEELVASATP